MENWPNFFIVGVPRAGTTSLYEYLKKIPEIFMSSNKEPDYFSAKTIPEEYFLKPIRDKKKYLDLFQNVKDEKIIGEASPRYMSDPDAPKLIYQMVPHAKILISLRDPVERLYSGYLMRFVHGRYKSSFHEELEFSLKHDTDDLSSQLDLKHGLYSDGVKRYLDIFGENHVKILIFEEWIKNPKETIKDLLKFLELENSTFDFEKKTYGKYITPKNPFAEYLVTSGTAAKIGKILPLKATNFLGKKFLYEENKQKPKIVKSDREFLINFYEEDVKKLRTILKRKFPWENFPEVN